MNPYTPQVQTFIVDIEFFARQFVTSLTHGEGSFTETGLLSEHPNILFQVYSESVHQIFKSLTPDFRDFSIELLTLPDFAYFIGSDKILQNRLTMHCLREAIKQLGMGIWMTLSSQGFFKESRTFIIENATLTDIRFSVHND